MIQDQAAILRQGVAVWNAWRDDHPDITIDLSGLDLSEADQAGEALWIAPLRRADLTGANLRGADLTHSYLPGAVLDEASLREAKMSGLVLTGASLWRADLTEAELSGSLLTEANLMLANLTKADLTAAVLSEAVLSGANLTGASMSQAYLVAASLSKADLTGAELSGAHLSGAKLDQAVLSEAVLQRADLSGADLSFASLRGADLRGAILLGADLTRADLSSSNLGQAVMAQTILTNATLVGAEMDGANIVEADLRKADLKGASLKKANVSRCDLTGAYFSHTQLTGATLTGCRVFDLPAWGVTTDETTKQADLIITSSGTPDISVDNLDVAHFLSLILYNAEARHVIDVLRSKVVMILGCFDDQSRARLDRFRAALSNLRDGQGRRRYVPVMLDCQPVTSDGSLPEEAAYLEPALILAGLSRLVIADFTDGKLMRRDVARIYEPAKVPLLPLLREDAPSRTVEDLRRVHPGVLPAHRYRDEEALLGNLGTLMRRAEAFLPPGQPQHSPEANAQP